MSVCVVYFGVCVDEFNGRACWFHGSREVIVLSSVAFSDDGGDLSPP